MTDSTPRDPRPAPEAVEKFERLKALLREMFQLDRGDLDFGLYRIMNMKAAEVAAFLDDELLPQARAALQAASDDDRRDLERKLEDLIYRAGSRARADESPTVIETRARLAEMKVDGDSEAEVYNHLAAFFSRYYREGDFVSQRRYTGGGGSSYLIPYNGEEVKLHWANADQYYIKTTENYAAYAFSLGDGGGRRARFEIAAADNEKDNVKEANGRQRRFVLAAGDGAVTFDDALLTARFEHRPLTDREKKRWPGNGTSQQRRIDAASCARILAAADASWRALLAAPAPTEANGDRTLLARHVERYTAKNSFDYFIHKDLGGFLHRELDLYLATEVLRMDDAAGKDMAARDRALAQTRAVREIGRKIVDFLAQLEDFQKRLWLKKKFVLETQWCVTLDRIPAAFYPEIAANAAQCAEWKALYAADEITGDLCNGGAAWRDPLGVDFLEANPFLIVDTRHFDREFADRLLAALSDAGPLDEQTDGLLVHGENFQALNLLQARFGGRVNSIHIDPPYNTGASNGFLYRNGYRHSSWLSMMCNRIDMGFRFLTRDGTFMCHIDENEQEKLQLLLDGKEVPDGGTIVWDKRNPMLGQRGIASRHEYILWRTGSDAKVLMQPRNARLIIAKAESLIRRHGGVTGESRGEFRKWITNQKSLSGGERAYQHIDDDGRVYQSVAMGAPEMRTDPKFFIPLTHPITGKECPAPSTGWSRAPETIQDLIAKNEIIFGKDESIQPRRKVFLDSETARQMSSVISDSGRGKNDLDKLGLEFPYCHPVSLYDEILYASARPKDSIVLDYFAGSGTAGHAVVNLNREDGGRRKYAMVEMGDHFDSVLLPRMKKVAYAPDWKDGKPVSREGVSQIFKYVRLESYEDTMDSLEVTPPPGEYLAANKELAEDYRLRYALGVETRGSASLLGKDFSDPFSYTLSVVRVGVRRETPVDLPETFNFLIGLTVASRQRIDGVLAITGVDREERRCLVLWRDLRRIDAAALDAWFTEHRARFADMLDVVYANGDHTLGALRKPGEGWIADVIEPALRELMFDSAD